MCPKAQFIHYPCCRAVSNVFNSSTSTLDIAWIAGNQGIAWNPLVVSLHKGPIMRQVCPWHNVIVITSIDRSQLVKIEFSFIGDCVIVIHSCRTQQCNGIKCRGRQWTGMNWSRSMMTSSNGHIFRVTGPLWGESTGHRWILLTKPVTQRLDVFFDLRLNKQLNKQSRPRRFGTPSRSLWRHCNEQATTSNVAKDSGRGWIG